MSPKEQMELLDALLDGEITEADFLRLEAELIVDPQVRQAYYRRLQLDLLLEEETNQDTPNGSFEISTGNAFGHRTHGHRTHGHSTLLNNGRWWLTGTLIAMAAAVTVMVIWKSGDDGRKVASSATETRADDQQSEPSATGFAILAGQDDAVWDGMQIAPGELIPAGDLHLVAGMVHLELFSGVQMVIQGDAEFSIDSPMQVSMSKGRARTHVPEPAQGFRLKTNRGDVVDLGTEFAIDVDDNRSTVAVVDGEVELYPRDANRLRLQDGQRAEMDASGSVSDRNVQPINLVGPTAFQGELARRQGDQFANWQQSLEVLRNDSRLIAHYLVDPDQGWDRRLINLASANRTGDVPPAAGDGAIVAATRADDRWGRTGGALDFSPMGSRVRVVVSGEHRGLTLSCWVKINSLDRWYNSLFLTDGHEEREPHWQIMDDGRLFFSVKPVQTEEMSNADRERQVFYSPPFWNTSMSGRWIMLSTVYDVDSKLVVHYLNGQPLNQTVIPDELLVDAIKIGAASICNWSQPMYRTDATFVVRNLNGSVDEFSLFAGALSPNEIYDLYQSGNPYDQ